jgi:hypothetical protein
VVAAHGQQVALVSVMLGVAVLLRLPNLMVVPRLTDETDEVILGLRIARGEALPLVGVNTYIGALFNYLVAGGFLILGPRPEVGRLTALTFGVLGIIPTYLLARRLGGAGWQGKAAGLIAALLLAVSPVDILVTSRIAYSHSLTPFFTTSGLWLLHRAVVGRSRQSFIASGVAFGLALQTHASGLAIWPGLAVYLLLRRRSVRLRWLPLAGAGATLMLANVLAYNVLHPWATVDEILFRSGTYGGVVSAGLVEWPFRLGTLLRSYALALGGRASEQVEPLSALLSPAVVGATALALAGLVLLVRRREWLPLLAIASTLLIVSVFNERVEPVVVRARHFAQILPLTLALVAVAIVAVHHRLASFGRRRLAHAVAMTMLSLLVVANTLAYGDYVSDRLARPNENNLALLTVAEAISRGSRTERVYLDVQLAAIRTISGGRMYSQIHYLLLLQGQELQALDFSRQELPIGRPGSASRRVVLSAASLDEVTRRYRLVPLPGDPGVGSLIRVFRAYARAPAS